MGLIVMKFGGTSVADVQKIRNAATRVAEEKKKGKEFSFVQITSVKEETAESFHQNIMFVIVMFVSKASANAFHPESPIP